MENRSTFLYIILALVLIFPVTLWSQQPKPSSTLPNEEADAYKQKATDIVSFLEGTLNFIGDRSNPVREKEVIFQESYLKMFRDPDVQVEDDLDEAREVVLYKDVQAYLKDIGFFFRNVRFQFNIQEISIFTKESGAPYFRVTVNRNLRGITVDNDSVNTNRVRYIEINLDEANSELKIVSMYTTKPNEREELRTWWNSLGEEWRQVLGADVQLNDTLSLADISLIQDSLVIVRNLETHFNTAPLISQIKRIVQSTTIDIHGLTIISSLEPLSRLSDLKSINCAGTMVSDLTPLRNLGSLEVLDCSGTLITSVQPIYYCINLKELKLSRNRITDITTIENLLKIEKLDLSLNPLISVASLSSLSALRDLRLSKTNIENLTSLSGLKNLEYLDISKTHVASLNPLSGCHALRILAADSTGIRSLEPLKNLTALQLIYCDQSGINRDIADAFMGLRPGVMVIFESGELIGWWNAMDQPWQQVFRKTDKLDATPTKEQLHQLIRKETLSIRKNKQIRHLQPVAKFLYLKTLDASGTGVNDVAPLAGLVNLNYLDLSQTPVASVEPLRKLFHLTQLDIDSSAVVDLNPIAGLKNLTLLYSDAIQAPREDIRAFMFAHPDCLVIYQTQSLADWYNALPESWKEVFLNAGGISGQPDRDELQQIVNLREIIIPDNTSINQLDPLLKMEKLTRLEFSNTQVGQLNVISSLVDLEILAFPKNPISDVKPLSTLKNLRELNMENTQVKDLKYLEDLISVTKLNISGTSISSLKPIQKWIRLQELEAYNTRISDLGVLDAMPSLKMLKVFKTKLSERKVQKFRETHPACEVIFY